MQQFAGVTKPKVIQPNRAKGGAPVEAWSNTEGAIGLLKKACWVVCLELTKSKVGGVDLRLGIYQGELTPVHNDLFTMQVGKRDELEV